MDSLGLGGEFLSGAGAGMLNLQASIDRRRQTQMSRPSLGQQQHMHVMGGYENDHHPIELMELKGSDSKGLSAPFTKGKSVIPFNAINTGNESEDDEPSFTEDDGNGEEINGAKSKKGSPWQRMKWTDNIVRLLIAIVACVGDDGILDGVKGLKRKSGILQKKGKWKTVSKIMMSKGCHVSPQQCEDKFNDLNKRYKRLNDILGRGTSCRVVENPNLMDSMPHLSAKAKEDVRKILSSKHLFYREMCAFHNGQKIPNCQDLDLPSAFLHAGRSAVEKNGSQEEEHGNDDSNDDESENDDDNNAEGYREMRGEYNDRTRDSEEDGHFWPQSNGHDSFETDMSVIFQDPSKSLQERKEWIKKQMLHLQEQRVNFQAQAFELEKQRLKWLRYCSKKDRELERLRLENERMKLENEHRVLQLRQKELEMKSRRSEAFMGHTSSGSDRLQGRDQIDLGRYQ
ncbi:putative transcription factor [Tripterygium wilfordii]|uniref:Putative transcription factor n=1 Tax=Tripterygium wilfordii TaxID=458696 RepID=A0A7J7DQW7_TRIWF|nr:uncharacterized protein LOC119995998 isoform X2 [Tripterygium wilfordii]XP_038698417.1 uncharacterized protein LOC119995998 isoform X2 [Tripterygium wilfordii]KAF5748760.1 putative transcription factor [Tripterygium wilfordii]